MGGIWSGWEDMIDKSTSISSDAKVSFFTATELITMYIYVSGE